MSPAPQDGLSSLLRLLHSVSISRFFVLTIAFFVVRFFARAIQRVYFHPLSKFPGPKLLAATRISGHIKTWNGTRHLSLMKLHREYGPVVRVNHDELSFTDPNAWRDIYGHGSKGTAGSSPTKDWLRYGKTLNGSPSLLQARDVDHSRQRKIFTPAFSDRALKQQEPLFLKYTNQLVAKLKESVQGDSNKRIDMIQMYNFCTFDIMGDLTFGESLHMLDKAAYDPWVSTIFSSVRMGARMSTLANYQIMVSIVRTLIPKSRNRARYNHFAHSVTRVTKRLEKGREAEGVDLWDLVLAQEDGKGLTRGEMDSNASLFMIAGTETTATLVSGLTYLLLTHPECMQKVVAEIRNAFANTDDMTMEKLAALPYYAACIKEAFRLYPPVPLGLPRTTPEDGSTICGHFVPPRTIVTIPQHAMYTHPQNFKRSFEYLPQRWLGDPEFASDQRHALQPFSVGARNCVGQNLAYHELRLIVAKVLFAFDLELAPECEGWLDQDTYILWQKKPLMCKLSAVN
ncbi:cytochrome P450 [Ophiobolus disseminans]|uniref:Cytochrome P450 n=1 Tax=Ophiobolus disseminans TaxID=1469910 RepID=A0A6A6ZD53_9PLEO|nr:cytochrome P450 [Ophiobolus disseminans]